MKKSFCRILSLIICMFMAMPALCAGAASAEEKGSAFLGKAFPDFTVADSEGNSFALSEALEGHQAVLINFWATWCGPCMSEFPFLNEAYGKYSDRVAFIALSTEDKDTTEIIEAYRKEHGIPFPMAWDEGQELYAYIGASSIPDTVIVDRFGNTVYFHSGAFLSAGALERVLDAFLGDGYTETAVLDRIPPDPSTHAFPVSAARAMYPDPESGDYKKALLWSSLDPTPVPCYIVPDDSVRIRIEIGPEDDAASMTYTDMYQYKFETVLNLLDPERGIYVYSQEMPDSSDEEQYTLIVLFDSATDDDPNEFSAYLYKDEAAIVKAVEEANASGNGEFRWEYADADKKAGDTPEAYILHVADQEGNPVEEVTVNFCTDTACVQKESDENGLITFTGARNIYHVTIIDAPDGYSWDEDYEMYTAREYGEWVLRVRKD